MQTKLLILATLASLASSQAMSQTSASTSKKKETKKSKSKEEVEKTESKPAEKGATTEEVKPLDLASLIAPLTLDELKTLQYLKEHFSFSYHGELYFQRRDGASDIPDERKIQDFRMLHSPTLIFRPVKGWQILATAEFKYSDVTPDPTFPNAYYRGLVSVTKKGLLTEAENKINMDLGVGRRDFNNKFAAVNGNYRIFSTLSKTLGKHNASVFVQYLRNDPKTWAPSTWKTGIEINPTINLQLTDKLSYLFNDDINYNTPYDSSKLDKKSTLTHEMNLAYLNYQWNDKINTYYQFKFYHLESYSFGSEDDYFEHYAGIGYALSPKAAFTLEVGTEVFHGSDGRDAFVKKAAYPDIALYVDLSL